MAPPQRGIFFRTYEPETRTTLRQLSTKFFNYTEISK